MRGTAVEVRQNSEDVSMCTMVVGSEVMVRAAAIVTVINITIQEDDGYDVTVTG